MESGPISLDFTTFSWALAGATFLAYLAVDALYAIYTIEVVRLRPASAATTGALIYVLSAFGIVNLVHNALYVIPLALGGWLGTFLVVWFQGRRGHRRGTLVGRQHAAPSAEPTESP
jgi:hypothetical protein